MAPHWYFNNWPVTLWTCHYATSFPHNYTSWDNWPFDKLARGTVVPLLFSNNINRRVFIKCDINQQFKRLLISYRCMLMRTPCEKELMEMIVKGKGFRQVSTRRTFHFASSEGSDSSKFSYLAIRRPPWWANFSCWDWRQTAANLSIPQKQTK